MTTTPAPRPRVFTVIRDDDANAFLTDGTETIPVIRIRNIGTGKGNVAIIELDGHTVYATGRDLYRDLCSACHGTGYRAGFEGIDGGRCWPCNYTGLISGDRFRHTKPSFAKARRTLAREAAKAEQARIEAEQKAAARRVEIQTWQEANPELITSARTILDDSKADEYHHHLANRVWVGNIDDDTLTAFQTAITERAAQAAAEAARVPVPTGRMAVTGELVSVKNNDYNQLKMLVLDDRGFKVWGTFPEALWGTERGLRVTFTAELAPSRNDPFFGFFARPTKASVVEN